MWSLDAEYGKPRIRLFRTSVLPGRGSAIKFLPGAVCYFGLPKLRVACSSAPQYLKCHPRRQSFKGCPLRAMQSCLHLVQVGSHDDFVRISLEQFTPWEMVARAAGCICQKTLPRGSKTTTLQSSSCTPYHVSRTLKGSDQPRPEDMSHDAAKLCYGSVLLEIPLPCPKVS